VTSTDDFYRPCKYADLAVDGNHVRDGGLDEKTIDEIHQMLRRALGDAARRKS
jgi:hypothetical protein